MRNLYSRISILIVFSLSLSWTNSVFSQNTDLPSPTPNVQKVPAGTYVIAMDNTLQSNPGYFNVKAYGLVVKILNSKKAVCWAIRSGKSKDDVDFSATASLVFPASGATSLRDFKAGPFLVLPRDSAGVAAVITAFNDGLLPSERVNVYQMTSDALVDIRYVLTQVPRVAILNDGSNSAVHAKYFQLAAIDSVINWRITAAINLDDSCYTFASEPHSDKVGPTIDSIRAYVMNGGNFLAQCRAINTYENEINGRFHTNNGIMIRNVNTAPNYIYPNPDLSFSQYEGRFDPILIGGSERNWTTASGSVYINNTHRHQSGSVGTDTNLVGQGVAKLAAGTGHLVFYAGGHDYAKSFTVDFVNGMRSYFNAMLTPSGVTKCNFLRFDNDLSVTKSAASSVCLGAKTEFTIVVTNNGPTETNSGSVVLRELFPTNGFYIESVVASKGTYSTATDEWTIGVMSLYERDTLTITATAIAPGIFENTVHLYRDEHDYDQSNDTASVSILVNEMSVSASSAAVTCFGSASGSATVVPSSGIPPFFYQWSNNATTADVSGLTAGNYSVEVVDSIGCSRTLVVTIASPDLLVSVLDSASNVACNGESNGAVSVTVTGGTAPFDYQWSNGAVTEDISNIPAGEYVLTVTDSLGCTTQFQQLVTEPTTLDPLISGTSFSVFNVSCNGGSDGMVQLSVQGGVPPYSFEWSNGAVDSVVSGLPAGPVQVTIFDSNGCSALANVTIAEPDAISPQLRSLSVYNGLYNVSCNNAADGTIDVFVEGGTPPYQFLWSNGEVTEDLNNVAAGSFELSVTDSLGCTGLLTVTLSQPDPLAVALTSPTFSNGANIACQGGTNGSVYSAVTGGTPPYSYSWNPNGAVTDSLTQLSAGYYLLDITDFNGCHTSGDILLTESDSLQVAAAANAADCFGNSTGVAAVTSIIGGSSPYSYRWSGYPDTTAVLSQVPAGSYTVMVTDVLGCSGLATVLVNQPNILALTLNAPLSGNGFHIACHGDNSAVVNSSVAGGTAPYMYSWGPLGATTPYVAGLPAGTYSLTLVDANGCHTAESVTITEPDAIMASSSSVEPGCNGQSTGSISVDSVSGGIAPYSYQWTGTMATTNSAVQLSAGNYEVTITDRNGCIFSRQFQLVDPPVLTLVLDHVITPVCHGGSDGSAAVSVAGGTAPVDIRWSVSGNTGPIITGLSAGNYNVLATDANGCTMSTDISVSDPPAVVAVPGAEQIICEGNTVQVGAELGSSETGTWSSSDPNLQFDNINSPTTLISGLANGFTDLQWTVSDIYGCTASAGLVIRSFGGVFATAGNDTAFCGDLGLLLSGNLPDSMTGMWTSMNGAVFSDPFDPNAIVNIVLRGPDTLRWTISNDYCEKSAYLAVQSNDCGFDMPTGYSPNGDGKNDDFEIKGLYSYPDNYLRVFNRWGNLVFSQEDYTGHEWKGQNNSGDPLPDGTYFVLFAANGSDFRRGSYVDIRR